MRTSEVFANIKSKDLLLKIASKRHIDVEEHSKNLGKAIADDAHTTGIKKFVDILPVTLLDQLGVNTKNDDGSKIQRAVLKKHIFHKVQEDTPQKFLNGLDAKVLANIVDAVFDEDEKPSKKVVEALVQKIDEIGLENALSTLSINELQDLCAVHKLRVDSSTSINAHIDALVSGEDQKKSKKKAEEEKPSKKKPSIAKGVAKIDLRHHFYREELVSYCKENNLAHTGSKTDLINTIINHLEGKDVPVTKKRKAPSGEKKDKSPKKAKTSKSDKTDKSDKIEKSEKEDTEDDKKSKESDTKEKENKEKENKEETKEDEKKEKPSRKGGKKKSE